MLLSKFSLTHVLWLSFVVFIRLVLFASVAVFSSFEVVILTLRALPSSFWEVEEKSVLFGDVIHFWGSSSNLGWHEDSTLWVEAWSIDSFSFDGSAVLILVTNWSLAKD